MKSKSKWHCIKDFTTERRKKATLPLWTGIGNCRQKYYRKKERLGIETKSKEKYDSENLMLIKPASE